MAKKESKHYAVDDTSHHQEVFKKDGMLRRAAYEELMHPLRIELIKLQNWVISKKKRLAVLFEGRDAAGKGGVIKAVTEHLNPRGARVVALLKPSDVEQGQWYFQRYIKQLPDPGEIAFFDRSWYNRAGVERVMDFCSQDEYQKFMRQVPLFEQMIVEDDILLFKYYLEIDKEEEKRRIHSRKNDPLKRWKLSDMDKISLEKYDEYSKAKEEMFSRTHSPYSPWIVVKANDKKRARISIIKDILSHIEYDGKEKSHVLLAPDPEIVSLYSHLHNY